MSKAENYYQERYAGRGLAPAHVVAVKKVISKALRKGEKPAAKVAAYLKEKGITLVSKEDADKKTTKKDLKKDPKPVPKPRTEPTPAKSEHPKKAKATPVVPLEQVEVKNMDRKSLKAVATQLTEMGVEVKVLKKDDDATLQRKVSDGLASLNSPEVLKTLERIDPTALVTTLKQDCLGLFVDLRSPSCLACSDNVDCVKRYLANLKGDFSAFKSVMRDIEVEEKAAVVAPEVAEAVTKATTKTKASAKEAKAAKLAYVASRVVFIQNVKNPCKKTHYAYGIYEKVLALDMEAEDGKIVGPTMATIRAMVEEEYEIDDDAFLTEWFNYLRSDGVVKLASDLDAEDRKFLADNGLTI